MLLHGQCHRGVAIYDLFALFFPSLHPRIVPVAWLTNRHTQFKQRAVAIGFVAVVVTRQSPTHRGKCTNVLAELIVGIDARLQ